MKYILCLFICISTYASELNLIVAGQSNAVGYTDAYWGSSYGLYTFNPTNNSFVNAFDPFPFFENPTPGGASPWILLGVFLKDKWPIINFVGHGKPGQPISYWDIGQVGWTQLQSNIQNSNLSFDAFIWYQGEADSTPDLCNNYFNKITNLLTRIRSITGKPALKMYVIELACDNPNFDNLRKVQRKFCDSDDGCILIPSADTPTQDGSHPNSYGQFLLALRLSKVIKGLK